VHAHRPRGRARSSRHGAALIEEFVEGTECGARRRESRRPGTPVTYMPIQYRFPEGETFKHSAMKWVDYGKMSAFPVADSTLAARLRDECARFFVALGGASFGRCDIRIDRDGTPFMLEINPNCGVYYPPADPGSADLCLMHDAEGHAGFTRLLIRAALRRLRAR
jgi:D-alanine-D-alanine ligase